MADSCMISFNLNCIMLLKQFFDIAFKVSSRKKRYYFWWSTWLLMWRHCNYYCCYRNLLRDHCESCFRLALGFRVYIICCLFHCFFTPRCKWLINYTITHYIFSCIDRLFLYNSLDAQWGIQWAMPSQYRVNILTLDLARRINSTQKLSSHI